MKDLRILSQIGLSLALISLSSLTFADKILVKGRPIILIPQADYYTFPQTYTPVTSYHFVDLSGDPRVCFINEQKTLSNLDLMRVPIVLNNKRYLWYCYNYDGRYFHIDY